MHENHASFIEGVFARGDRRVADVLEAAWRAGAASTAGTSAARRALGRAIAETAARTGVDISRYLGTLPVTARLPWDHIDVGLEDGFLLEEYRKALKDRLSPPCGKPFKQLLHPTNLADAEADARPKLVCYDCGVACDLDAMKQRAAVLPAAHERVAAGGARTGGGRALRPSDDSRRRQGSSRSPRPPSRP